MFHRHAFTIHEHVLDAKPTWDVDGLHMLGRLHKLFDLAVENVFGGSELGMLTNGGKEGDFVDEEKVAS